MQNYELNVYLTQRILFWYPATSRLSMSIPNSMVMHLLLCGIMVKNKVGWVTQLVVHKAVHRRYIATQLLQALKFHALFSDVNIVGLASSHPVSCNALAKYAAGNINNVNLDFIHEHAKGILESSPISYLKAAQLRGTLFQDNCDNKAISSVFTEFYIDHTEPLAVLQQYKKRGRWCLGELLDGCEFLAIFPIAVSLESY